MVTLCVLVLLSIVASALTHGRTLPPVTSVTAYRPAGETRIWTFESRDTVVGSLSSHVLESVEYESQPAVRIRATLSLDYRKIGSELIIHIAGEHTLTPNGRFLAESLSVTLAGLTESSHSRLSGDSIRTLFERGDQPVERAIVRPGSGYAWDQNFIDQLEIYLAMRTLSEGLDIIDTIYLTQAMVSAPVDMTVGEFGWTRLFANRSDSVFTIRIRQPQPMVAYVNTKHRLVKAELLGTNTKVYLDRIQTETLPKSEVSGFNWKRLSSQLPHWLAYGVIMVGVLALLAVPFFRRRELWSAVAAGALLGFLIPFVQRPLQEYVISQWFVPAVTGGGSMAVWGVLPGGVTALFQEIIKFSLIATLLSRIRLRIPALAAGAAVGAGFGLSEVVYLSIVGGSGQLFSWQLLERGFFLMFHAGSGVLIAYAWAHARVRVPGMLAITIVFNLLLRYLPLLVQRKVVTVELAHLILGFLCLTLITGVIALQKNVRMPTRPIQP